METVQFCFQAVGSHLDKEQKECKNRLEVLDKAVSKYRIGRVYEDKTQTLVDCLEKDRNILIETIELPKHRIE